MKHVLASWKMFLTVGEAQTLFEEIQAGLRQRADGGAALPHVIVCPSYVSLAPLRAVADDRLVHLGAQNCHWEQEGPFTGEISPRMLQGLAEYVLLGHSERREMGETDEQIARKVAAAAEAGLVPILFVGEDDRSSDGLHHAEQRLRHGLAGVDSARQPVVVVYEPTWAIGAQEAAPPDHVGRVVDRLKSVLVESGVKRPVVLYGGTVAPHTLDDLARLDVLDGLGATRSSLQAESFLRLVDRLGGA